MAATDAEAAAAAAEPPPYINAEAPPPRRHEEYYFEDGNLVILVSGVLFRLWDGVFRRHSTAFPLPPSKDKDKAGVGVDDAHPLVLADVDSADFERLLWVVHPSVIGQCRATSPADWTAVLALATRWAFPDLRALAIRELGTLPLAGAPDAASSSGASSSSGVARALDGTAGETKRELTPVEKIALAQQFDVPRAWAREAYLALCARNEPLELHEARRLGIETVVRVACAREKLDKWGRKKPDEVKKVVAEVFEIPAEGE
ncbi:hypothetical protein FB451DRAFT_1256523 [Mycena latifolia]|nr:hypothetical protein FB451DRAFT_1256523 [Mycena latifolia]